MKQEIPSFSSYQTLERKLHGPGAPNRNIHDRIIECGLSDYMDEDSAVLDLGCNRGYFGIAMSGKIKSYTGVEVSSEIEFGIKEAEQRNIKNCEYVRSTIEEFSVNNEKTYDLILSLAVIAYLEWDMPKLSEWLESICNPNAIVIVEGHPDGYMGEPDRCLNPLIDAMKYRSVEVKRFNTFDRGMKRSIVHFRMPFSSGMASRIFRDGETITKLYRHESEREEQVICHHRKNEAIAYQALEGCSGFPRIESIDDYSIVMNYVGEPVTPDTLPSDWREQIRRIESEMDARGIWHADAKTNNICVLDGKLTLVDLGMFHRSSDRYTSPIKHIEGMLK